MPLSPSRLSRSPQLEIFHFYVAYPLEWRVGIYLPSLNSPQCMCSPGKEPRYQKVCVGQRGPTGPRGCQRPGTRSLNNSALGKSPSEVGQAGGLARTNRPFGAPITASLGLQPQRLLTFHFGRAQHPWGLNSLSIWGCSSASEQ